MLDFIGLQRNFFIRNVIEYLFKSVINIRYFKIRIGLPNKPFNIIISHLLKIMK